jgi:hypothetical protein
VDRAACVDGGGGVESGRLDRVMRVGGGCGVDKVGGGLVLVREGSGGG